MGYGSTNKEAYAPMGADLSNTSIYVWDRAEYRDKKWTAVYLLTLVSTLGIGLFAYKHKNVSYDTLATPESLAVRRIRTTQPATCLVTCLTLLMKQANSRSQ